MLQGKEHLNIFYNEHVHDISTVLEESDILSLLYIMDSERITDKNGQNWTMLDAMFLKVLEELKGGYV